MTAARSRGIGPGAAFPAVPASSASERLEALLDELAANPHVGAALTNRLSVMINAVQRLERGVCVACRQQLDRRERARALAKAIDLGAARQQEIDELADLVLHGFSEPYCGVVHPADHEEDMDAERVCQRPEGHDGEHLFTKWGER